MDATEVENDICKWTRFVHFHLGKRQHHSISATAIDSFCSDEKLAEVWRVYFNMGAGAAVVNIFRILNAVVGLCVRKGLVGLTSVLHLYFVSSLSCIGQDM